MGEILSVAESLSRKIKEHCQSHSCNHQGGHWSGKSRGNLIFLQGQGKVREFCKLVREILNTKKVREKSGNFIILVQNMCCSRYFDYLECEKSVDFFSRLLSSLETMKTC